MVVCLPTCREANGYGRIRRQGNSRKRTGLLNEVQFIITRRKMNSFKKIAVITAAAMIGVLSSMPANADASPTPFSVEVNSNTNTSTSVAPMAMLVPSSNVIDAGHAIAISASADTNTAVSFSASSTVKLVSALNTELSPKNVSSGVSSLSGVSNGSKITVYAYTTSTATGYVTVVNGGYSTVVFVKGVAGPAYNVGLNVPTSVAVGTIPNVVVSSTDVFGNPVANQPITINLVGTTFADATISKVLFTSAITDSSAGTTLGLKATALAVASAGVVTVFAADASIGLQVAGLPAPVKTVMASFVVADLNAQILALKAELALEKAALATANAALAATKAELAIEKAAHETAKKSSLDAAAKAVSDASAAKVLSDKALADAIAKSTSDLSAVNTAAAAQIKNYKLKYNALAKKWNKYHSTKVALLK